MTDGTREDYFTYKEGDLQIARSQCELCKFYRKEEESLCAVYRKIRPADVVEGDVMCRNFEG
jgi:hypothetical protein